MPCDLVQLPNGTRAIVCSGGRRKRCACGAPAPLLCDWKVPGKRSGTCDAPLCRNCATKPVLSSAEGPAPEKDLCPEHARAFEAWKARRQRENA